MDEFGEINANHTKASGDQKQFLAFLNGLGAPPDIEFRKEVGAVGFDGVDGDEQLVGDLLVAETSGHELEDLEFPFADAELFEAQRIGLEIGDRNGNLNGFFPRELEPCPGANSGENEGEDAGVEFHGKVADKITVLQELEDKDQGCQGEAVEENCFSHKAKIAVCGRMVNGQRVKSSLLVILIYLASSKSLNQLPLQFTT
jgi:hypothetical protein